MSANAETIEAGKVDVVKVKTETNEVEDNEEELSKEIESGTPAEGEEVETGAVDVIKPKVEGSQPTKVVTQQELDAMIGRRVGRQKGKTNEANAQKDEANAKLAAANETIKVQQLAIDQHRGKAATLKRPVPADFDAGDEDPEFIKALDLYTDARVEAQVLKHVGKSNENASANAVQVDRDKNLAVKAEAHYKRAIEFGAKDFQATEDRAIAILGDDTVDQVISNFDDSHIILYYLGKETNAQEAENLATLIKANPVKGVAALGALQRELEVVTDGKPAPNPDGEVEGGLPGNKLTQRGPKGATYE